MHALPLPPSKPTRPASAILAALLLRTGLDVPPALLSLSLSLSPLNAALSAFARNNFPSLALRTFSLLHRLALPLDSYSLCSSLSASNKLPTPTPAKQIHAIAYQTGHIYNVFVCGALVDSYSRNTTGSLQDARRFFDETPVKNTVCANSLLNGYVDRRLWTQGLSLVQAMQQAPPGLQPDEQTVSCVLRICGEAAVVEFGRQAHGYLIRSCSSTTRRDVVLLSCLVEMYGRCGLSGKARLVFETGSREGRRGRDVVLWTSMLNAYGRNGQFDDVIKAFEEMLAERTEPDGVVFLAVLSACGRSGNVKKGLEFMELMGRSYGLVSGPEHYGCMVDMLCRAGEVDKAWKFANEMEVAGIGKRIGASSWGAILSACRDTGNFEIGVAAARKGLELDPCNVGVLVELSNLYANLGMWDEIGALREEIRERGLEKDVGNSRLESANY